MCYQKALTKELETVQKYMQRQLLEPDSYTPYYALNGFTHGNIYIVPIDQPDIISAATWGLVPPYKMNVINDFFKNGWNTLNARSEDIFDNKTYKAHTDQRCLMIADGVIEPHHYDKKNSQPFFMYQPNEMFDDGKGLMCIAGLYSMDSNNNYYVTMLTIDGNDTFNEVHNKAKRMPLILNENFFDYWVDKSLNEGDIKEVIKAGVTNENFNYYPITNDIYKGANPFDKSVINRVEPNGLML